MNELLARLREEGEIEEDDGRFTLDPRRAAELLGQRRLAEPGRYGLLVALAAVRLKATSLSLTDRGHVDAWHLENVGLDARALRALADSKLGRGPLQSLELAILAARGFKPQRLVLESEGQRLIVLAESHRIEACPLEPGLKLEVHHPRTLFSSRPQESQPSPAIRKHCVHSPIPVSVNGELVTRPVDLTRSLACAQLEGSFPVGSRTGEQLARLRERTEEEWSAAVGIWPPTAHESSVTVVCEGLAYPVTGARLPRWVSAVIWTGKVRPDLSMSAASAGPELDYLLDRVAAVVTRLVLAMAEKLGELNLGSMQAVLDVCEEEAQRATPDEEWLELLYRILEARRKWFVADPRGLGPSLLRVADMERALGRKADAERHYSEALPYLEQAGAKPATRLPVYAALVELMEARQAADAEAQPVLSEYLRLWERVNPVVQRGKMSVDTLRVVRCMEWLASICERGGNLAQAEQHLKKLLRLKEDHLDVNSPELTPVLNRLYRLVFKQKRQVEADNLRQRSLEIYSLHPAKAEEPPDL